MRLRVSDHALLRFMERGGGLDVEAVRCALAASLDRAAHAAEAIGADRYTVKAWGLIYRVVDGTLVTVTRAPERRP